MSGEHELFTVPASGWWFDRTFMERIEERLIDLYDKMSAITYDDADYEVPSGQVYCGCDVCDRREIIATVVPLVLEGVETGSIRRHHPDDRCACGNVGREDECEDGCEIEPG